LDQSPSSAFAAKAFRSLASTTTCLLCSKQLRCVTWSPASVLEPGIWNRTGLTTTFGGSTIFRSLRTIFPIGNFPEISRVPQARSTPLTGATGTDNNRSQGAPMQRADPNEPLLEDMYRSRFKDQTESRIQMWKVLCDSFFQRFIEKEATVLEVAAGQCEFINNIKAKRKIAVDINPDTRTLAGPDVEVHIRPATDLSIIPADSIDVAFISNFFEHIPKDDIVTTIRECHRVLRQGGQLIILQPNIRYCYKDYWMFFDHITPLDDRALCEVIELIGFSIVISVPRFLPYTTKSRLPRSLFLIRLYLKLPFFWKLFGAQALIVARH
jgi:SAM-dependent methyltransferase